MPENQAAYPSPWSLLREAWRLYYARFRTILPICALALAANILNRVTAGGPDAINFISSFLNFIVGYLSFIAILFAFASVDTPQTTYLDFYHKAWKIFMPYIVVLALTLVSLIAAGILTLLPLIGSVLFPQFGVYLAVLMIATMLPAIAIGTYIAFGMYIVVFEGLQGFRAVAQSWRYVRGDWWKIFWRLLFCFALLLIVYLVGRIVFGFAGPASLVAFILMQIVVSILIMPILAAYMYALYESVHDKKAGPIFEQDVRQTRNRLIVVIAVGIVASLLISGLFAILIHRGYLKEEFTLPPAISEK